MMVYCAVQIANLTTTADKSADTRHQVANVSEEWWVTLT